MKVLMINGSARKDGNTNRALLEMQKEFTKQNIETEIMYVGGKDIRGCRVCGGCGKTNRCIIHDEVNEALDKFEQCDGLVIASPVYYASPNGTLISFLDRLYYAGSKETFANKPCATLAVARRAGTVASCDVLNKYPMISNMPLVASQYWNVGFGLTPNQIEQDEEGMQIMRQLARNMSWLLKSIEEGKKNGLKEPEHEPSVATHFIK